MGLAAVVLLCVVGFIGCATVGGGGGDGDGDDGGAAGETITYDPLPPRSNQTDQLDAYTLKTRWQKDEITYYLVAPTGDLSVEEQEDIFDEAFQIWGDPIPITFRRVDTVAEADMIQGFGGRQYLRSVYSRRYHLPGY